MVAQSGLPVEVCVGKTPELMRLADCAMAVSGSVSLELLYHTTPTVILYWISRFGLFRAGVFSQGEVHYAGEPVGYGGGGDGRGQGSGARGQGAGIRGQGSVVSGQSEAADAKAATSNPQSLIPNPSPLPEQALFPEYLTCEDKSDEIARHVIGWLTDPAKRADRVDALAALKAEVAHGGASRRAAEYILNALRLSPLLGNPQCQQVELALQIA